MVQQRRELQRQESRLMERMATAGLVDTIPIRPAIEARRWLHYGIDALDEARSCGWRVISDVRPSRTEGIRLSAGTP